jgi:hypothetical protein
MAFMQISPELLDQMWGNWHSNVNSIDHARGLILQIKAPVYAAYVC